MSRSLKTKKKLKNLERYSKYKKGNLNIISWTSII